MPFPSFFQLRERSSRTVVDGTEVERMTNGALRVRAMFDRPRADMTIAHVLSAAQWDVLWAHYLASRDGVDTLTWQETGESYTVKYVQAPKRRAIGAMFDVTYRVMEV